MAIEQTKTKKTVTKKTAAKKTVKAAPKVAKKAVRRKTTKAEVAADAVAPAPAAAAAISADVSAPAKPAARGRKPAAPKAEAADRKPTRIPPARKPATGAASTAPAAATVWGDDDHAAPAVVQPPRRQPPKAEQPERARAEARQTPPADRRPAPHARREPVEAPAKPAPVPAPSKPSAAKPAVPGSVDERVPPADGDGERRGRRRGRRGRGRGRDRAEGGPRPDDQKAPVGRAPAAAPSDLDANDMPRNDRGPAPARPDEDDRGPRRKRRRRGGKGRGESATTDGPAARRGPAARVAEVADVEVLDDDFDTELPMEPTWSAGNDDDSYDDGDVDVLDEVTELSPEADWEEPDESDTDDDAPKPSTGTREMLINVSAGDEVRIAVLESKKLEELFIERSGTQSQVGNIYKGKVTNVESSIQAVFIDFGGPKNGFLHISDVQPQYFGKRGMPAEDVGRKIPRHSRPPIQECFKRGQEVIVQITKDGLGTKGPTLSTYLSIPGRFIVMMPGMNKLGVSRKIEDDDARRKMRDILNQLDLPSGFGFILRTAGIGRSRRELQRDLNYLVRLWRTVAECVKREPAPAELYRESDLVSRTIRDVYTQEFRRLITDDALTAEKARQFLQIVMPKIASPVELYTEREPLFHRYGIEAEIEKINMRHVPLPSGGSIVIDQTEAMVAIDVNSGKFRTPDDPETTALKINLEAAEEIARQLRLRDLGGLIVCDFIDMRYERNRKAVENAMRDALMLHKERVRVLRMSAFGLIEITRQRRGPSIKRNSYLDCQHCKGTGLIKMPESVVLDVMRIIQLATHRNDVHRVAVSVANDVAFQILNTKRVVLAEVEKETGKQIVVRGEPGFTPDEVSFRCEDAQGRIVKFTAGVAAGPEPRRR
jgi:ribonuclease E